MIMSFIKKLTAWFFIICSLLMITFFLLVNFVPSPVYYRGPVSDHFNGEIFHNPIDKDIKLPAKKSFWKWQLDRQSVKWPDHVVTKSFPSPPARVQGNELLVTFVGHATVLLQTQGLNILTDPIWSERASPIFFAGPKRTTDPGIKFDELPTIDVVLISHNHYDHMDLPTLKKLNKRDKPVFILGIGTDAQLKDRLSKLNIIGLDWDEKFKINNKISVYFVPVQHWSQRTLWDRNRTLWGGFVIKTPDGNIYFGGDAGYGNGKNYRYIKKHYSPIRLAILPIGAYMPRWFMVYSHLNPEEAVMAFKDMGAKYGIPIHFQTFKLSDESFEQPLIDLKKAKKKLAVGQDFRALEIGQSWQVPN